MKKLFLLLLMLIFGLVACVNPKEADIVTTMYIQYDIATNIAQDKMSVSMLVAPGAEVHGYEPSSRDIEAIKKAKLFIYTSLEMDAWIKDPDTLIGESTIAMDLSKAYQYEEEHSHKDNMSFRNSSLHHDHDDLHYWTDPVIFLALINAILEEIVEIDPDNEEFYKENAHKYYDEILDLHHDFEDFIHPDHNNSSIYFAGHNAMGSFAKRYNINIVALSDTSNPDADLTIAQLEALINEIKSNNAKFLFIEELKEPKVAKTIQRQLAGEDYELNLLLLHGYHNI